MNRAVLKRKVEQRVILAKTSYHYDGRAVTGEKTPGNDWKPARIRDDKWLDGYYNIRADEFRGHGHMSVHGPNEWELWYAGSGMLLKEVTPEEYAKAVAAIGRRS